MHRDITFLVTGQALIRSDIRNIQDPEFRKIVARVRAADIAFTNFEGVVIGPNCWPTKEAYCGAVQPDTLDALLEMGFSALALANNHSFDLGPGGILETLKQARNRPFICAGIGEDSSTASVPAFRDYPFGRVALLAMHCGDRNEARTCRALDAQQGIPARPGVNMLEVAPGANVQEGGFLESDMVRHLEAIRGAKASANFVIVYIHHHTTGCTPEEPPAAYRKFCQACVDAGANVVVGHGTPVFQGVEVYKNQPIFFNAANFIFHTQGVEMWSGRYGAKPWESYIASLAFLANGHLSSLEVHPITLGDPEKLVAAGLQDRKKSYPVFANLKRGEEILQRITALSEDLGILLEPRRSESGQWIGEWQRQ